LAFNKPTGEAVIFNWDEDFHVGKKYVLGYQYERKQREPGDDVLPLFDEYAAGFSGCDNFNQCMHGKTWSYRNSSDAQAANDYMFTSILINTYHLWQDVGNDRDDVSFSDFCEMLAIDMVDQIRN